MRLAVVACLAAGLFAETAGADPLTVGQLLGRCGKLDVSENQIKLRAATVGDALDAGKCWGHLEAYLDLATIELPAANNATIHPLGACPTTRSINFTQVAQMFLQHARNNPADLQKPAVQIVANLLAQKYPCRK